MYALHEPTGMTGTETLDELDRCNLDGRLKRTTA
jgi:hypothetical protein